MCCYMSVSHFAGCRLRVRGAAACSVGQLWRRPPAPLSCLPLPRPPRAGLRSSSLAPGGAELAPHANLLLELDDHVALAAALRAEPAEGWGGRRGGQRVLNECGTGGYRDR